MENNKRELPLRKHLISLHDLLGQAVLNSFEHKTVHYQRFYKCPTLPLQMYLKASFPVFYVLCEDLKHFVPMDNT